jgi:heat shock protein HtpX
MRRRRELFPTDRGLVARMVLTAVATPLIVVAALAVLALFAPWKLVAAVAVASVVGIAMAMDERAKRASAREATRAEAPELHAMLERLCLLADLPKPRIVIEPEALPNSWVVSIGRGHSSLHLTEGLLRRLERAELEAVIAHELAHVAQRDAAVMTIVGGPGAVLLGGGQRMMRGCGIWFVTIGGVTAMAIGWLGTVGTRALSRYREFAADAGAAALTGHPAALASALMKVSEGLVAIPSEDLRAAAARDAFHLLPVGARERAGRLPLPATHPSLRARIARLERMEATLQAARPALRDEALR